jgi:hypothetical protein
LALKDKHGGGEKQTLYLRMQVFYGVSLGEGYPTFFPLGLSPISQKLLYPQHHLSQNLIS